MTITSSLLALRTIVMAHASTMISAGSMVGCFIATRRKQSSKSPSESFMMLALWTTVTRLRSFFSAYRKAYSQMREAAPLGDELDALRDARHDHQLEAGVEVLGVLAHDDDVGPLEPRLDAGEAADGAHVGVEIERLAQRDVDGAEALADGRADRALERDAVLRIESSTSCGSVVPVFSATAAPASCTSQSMATPAASRTRCVAAHTSGPMPSPGINVTVCFKTRHL